MQRTFSVLILAAILGVGIVVGLSARSLLDMREDGQDVSTASSSSGGPASVSAAPAAGAPSAAMMPARPDAAAAPRDVVLEVTEAQLESQLNQLLVGQSLGATPLGDATVQSVTVQLRDRLIRVGGGAKAGFLQAPFLTAGTIMPDPNGRPLVMISQASVGGVDLPEAARTALSDVLQGHVDEMLTDRSVKVRTVEIADGKMRIEGTSGS